MFTEANDLAILTEKKRLEAKKKRMASQREAASSLEALNLQQQAQMRKLEEHARYDQLRQQEALKTPVPCMKAPPVVPVDHKFQDGGAFVSTFNPAFAIEEHPLHIAVPHVHNPYQDSKPAPADKHKPQTNNSRHVCVPYESPTTALSNVTMTPTANSTETKDAKSPHVNNDQTIEDVAAYPLLGAELPNFPHLCGPSSVIQPSLNNLRMIPVSNNKVTHDVAKHSVPRADPPGLAPVGGSLSIIQPSLTNCSSIVQPNSRAKTTDMIPPVRRDTSNSSSPTEIEVIDLTVDASENNSEEPPKKKGKRTTVDVVVMVTMPGFLEPIVKKVQCMVEQDSD
jgi:hypothetical protein